MRALGAGVLVTFFLTAFGATPVESAYQEMQVNRGLTRPVYAAEADASIQCFGHNFGSPGTAVMGYSSLSLAGRPDGPVRARLYAGGGQVRDSSLGEMGASERAGRVRARSGDDRAGAVAGGDHARRPGAADHANSGRAEILALASTCQR